MKSKVTVSLIYTALVFIAPSLSGCAAFNAAYFSDLDAVNYEQGSKTDTEFRMDAAKCELTANPESYYGTYNLRYDACMRAKGYDRHYIR